MKTNYLLLSALLGLVASGCVVGPEYHRPETAVPPHWSEPLAGGETNAPAALAEWWKSFHDPELDSLVQRAVESNLDLRLARARVRAARVEYQIASANLWPSADASGSYSREQASHHQPVLGSLPIPASVPFENNVYQAGLDASWEIDVFGGKRRQTQAAQAEATASEFGRDDVVLTLLGDVARNYTDLRGYQRELAITKENTTAQEQALAITRERFAHGLTSDLDVQQAATVLSTTRASVPVLENAIQAAMNRLAVLLGQPPGALLAELANAAPLPPTPPSVPLGLPSDLLLRRPDVRQAERRLAAATANIGVAKADLFPRFSLTGAAGLESVSASDWFTSGSKFWSIGPTVQWRIFDAGRIRANIKVKTALQEQALAAYEQTTLRAFEDVENAMVAYAKEQTRRDSLAQAATTSQNSLNLARRLYTSGLTDFVNVLDAERSLYQTQDQLAQSDRIISADLIALYKALGGGWETMASHGALARVEDTHTR